jgi:hypothetical protein
VREQDGGSTETTTSLSIPHKPIHTIAMKAIAFHLKPGDRASIPVVGFTPEDGPGAIELFQSHDEGEFMHQSHRPQ